MDRPSYLSVVLHFVRLGTCCLSQCCRCNTRWTERNMSLFLALQLIVSCLCLVQAEPVLSKERVVMTTSHGDIQLGFILRYAHGSLYLQSSWPTTIALLFLVHRSGQAARNAEADSSACTPRSSSQDRAHCIMHHCDCIIRSSALACLNYGDEPDHLCRWHPSQCNT